MKLLLAFVLAAFGGSCLFSGCKEGAIEEATYSSATLTPEVTSRLAREGWTKYKVEGDFVTFRREKASVERQGEGGGHSTPRPNLDNAELRKVNDGIRDLQRQQATDAAYTLKMMEYDRQMAEYERKRAEGKFAFPPSKPMKTFGP